MYWLKVEGSMPSDAVLKQVQRLLKASAPVSENDVRGLAHLLMKKGEEEVVFLLLQLIQRIRALQENHSDAPSPSTPSGMIPPFQKASTQTGKKKKRKKKAGGQKGHPGSHRPTLEKIDRREEHRLNCCPDCGGPLQQCNGENSVRSRIVEDIPADIQPEVTEHVLYRDYCPRCKKLVEPKVESALPKSTIGNRLLVLTAYWHYALGMTTAQILDTLNSHLQFGLSKGGADSAMASVANRLADLVRSPGRRDPEIGGTARRRNGMAGQRRDALVVVLFQRSDHVLSDRPQPGRSGLEATLQGDVFRNTGHRLLGDVRRHGGWGASVLPVPSAQRIGKGEST